MKEEEGKTDEAATLVQEVQARIRDSLRLWQEGGGQTGPVMELRFFGVEVGTRSLQKTGVSTRAWR